MLNVEPVVKVPILIDDVDVVAYLSPFVPEVPDVP
jgi:hypothetical protein